MWGSVMHLESDTIDMARDRLQKDIYAREGVWDMQKMTLSPFRTAVRQ